ncbi:MAG: HAD-IB family hydrolase [Microthrixaceae bacterium]
MNQRATRKVAAFDFDGTLSQRDTLIPFLISVTGRARFAQIASQIGLSGALRGVDLRNRDAVKAQMIHRSMCGRRNQDLLRLGEVYSQDLLAHELNPVTLQRLEQHREAGHELVFVSASLTYYLDPLASSLGVGSVIAVKPTVEHGLLTGQMEYPNVRAEQKAIRLRSWLEQPAIGPMPEIELWAYGNSSGDHALLQMANHAFWLGKPSKLPAGSQVLIPSSAPFASR